MSSNISLSKAIALALCFLLPLSGLSQAQLFPNGFTLNPNLQAESRPTRRATNSSKDAFLNQLVRKMTVPELVLQMQLTFADSIIGPKSDNGLWDETMHLAPNASIGIMHDWYPTNKSQYNGMQTLNKNKSRLDIPILQTGECLHGVGSFKQSMFPQNIGMSASFDTDIVHRVGRAIGSEASSIGIHACFAPVLDLGKDPRWGRVQEAWGEDMVLTSHMGVAYASGLSKNGTLSDQDAVVPVMKHFAAHGSPQGGHNAAPFMGYGVREVLQEMLVPFKAVVDLGGVKGVMMAYSEFDDVPCSVNPLLYKALDDWGYDGFVMGDDTALSELMSTHLVTSSVADTITQFHNAGGIIQYYDFPQDQYITTTVDLVNNGTVKLSTLQALVKRVLGVKYDLGLFDNPFIADDVDSQAITDSNVPLTLEAAHKSIVLLENNGSTLPLKPKDQGISSIALIGPYADTFNFGDYSGQWGGYPVAKASTLRQAMTKYLAAYASGTTLVSSWGANSWEYNGQYSIPPYLLSANGTSGGLQATYYATTNFTDPRVHKIETPSLDWGLYPPTGLPSNNFSATWEGTLTVPVDSEVKGWLGAAVYANTTAKLYVDGKLIVTSPATTSGNLLSDIPGIGQSQTAPPPGATSFTFKKGATHQIRLEYQAWNYYQKLANSNSLNAQLLLFWNLVDQSDPVGKAVDLAKSSDIVVLAVGAAWNSDGEGGDRGTLSLSTNQTALADAIFALGKPVVLVLYGGRPFAIPQYYSQAAAVLNTFFPGQSGGQAVADTLFGLNNPGGRIPLSVPTDVGTLPVFYNYKPTYPHDYVDIHYEPTYAFGYGLSYSTFSLSGFTASATGGSSGNATKRDGASGFSPTSTVTFSVTVANTGSVAGSYVPQVYLLGRVSSITRPMRQLVAFTRVYLDAGETRTVHMPLDVARYLTILDRDYKWTVESGDYMFELLENGGSSAASSGNVTLTCS